MSIRKIIALVFACVILGTGALAEAQVLRAGGLVGDALYVVGGDQQKEMLSLQNIVLSKSGLTIEFTEYNTMQEGFEALQNGEIDTLYPMTPFRRDLEPLGLTASNPVYDISWDIVFIGKYSEEKLARIAVPGGRLAPYYCREVFPNSELVLCGSRLDCLDAVIDGRADCAIFNGFQSENIVQNGPKYSSLTYTVLPTDCAATFVVREGDEEHLAIVNECIAKTTELEMTDYMVRSRAVSVEESARLAFISKYRTIFFAVIAFLVVAILVVIIITQRVILPLREFNRCMEKNEKLPFRGTGNLKRLAATFNQLYDETAEKHRVLRDEAQHDGLTGLLNRRSFDDYLQSFESLKEPYMLIIADIDHFKEINDQYGHAVGDQILKKISGILVGSFRRGDLICRVGGDEFAVIAANPNPGFDRILARKIEIINRRLSAPEDDLPATALSTGAAYAGEGLSSEAVFRNADAALYQVKANGRGGFKLYEGE